MRRSMKSMYLLAGCASLLMGCSEDDLVPCGDVIGINYHQDSGEFITIDDLKGRWYAIGTSMDQEWGKGECTQQHYDPIEAPAGQAAFAETMSWINPTGTFTGINTMLDVNNPNQMLFTKPDAGIFQDLFKMPWTLFAMGSEPAEYAALYFCKPLKDGDDKTIWQFQGFDIVTRTQNLDEIAAIEDKVLTLAIEQGMSVESYISLPQGPQCDPIEDFENE